MVGEMREPEVMRLTLNAAETGHLVLATVHSASAAEALSRVVSAFPPEMQAAVCAQLADCIVGVVCQRLRYRPEVGLRVPECEVLMGSTPVKSIVRQGHFYKIPSAIETGAADGCWSFPRYAEWLARKTDWSQPSTVSEEAPAAAPEPEPASAQETLLPAARPRPVAVTRLPARTRRSASPSKPTESRAAEEGVFVIPGEQDDLVSIIRELEEDGG
jgi:twitching motility protein PilT